MKNSRKWQGGYNSSSLGNAVIIIITVLLAVTLAVLLWIDKCQWDKSAKETDAKNRQIYEEQLAKEEALKQKMEQDSFFQKLSDGFDVNILIIGDSIGEGAGASSSNTFWVTKLQSYLHETYGGAAGITNVSMGGNASYAGYVRTMALDDGVDYDLAIICYGHNDGVDGFATNYESIIRAVRSRYKNCSIISVLESSQREYTDKMKAIQNLCGHYGIPIADTIASFNDSDKAYEDLSEDGVHPNDAGQQIYCDTLKTVIDENVALSTSKMKDSDPVNKDVHKFDNFKWYDVNTDFERDDDTTFVLKTNNAGILGIDYTFESGDNKADIFIDGKLYESPTVTFNYDFSQRHIMVVSDSCEVTDEIKIVFSSKVQADGFKGMCFSWK